MEIVECAFQPLLDFLLVQPFDKHSRSLASKNHLDRRYQRPDGVSEATAIIERPCIQHFDFTRAFLGSQTAFTSSTVLRWIGWGVLSLRVINFGNSSLLA